LIVLASFVLVVTGCACLQTHQCSQDENFSVSNLIYFGASKPDGVVTPEQWADFLKNNVTPRFPTGFTEWKASGQWKNTDGKILQEESFVLNIVHPDDKSGDESIRSIIREYKAQFGQEAVLRVRSAACASF